MRKYGVLWLFILFAIASVVAIYFLVIKKDSQIVSSNLVTSCRSIVTTANISYQKDIMAGAKGPLEYSSIDCKKKNGAKDLEIKGSSNFGYYVKVEETGKIIELDCFDTAYHYHYSGNELSTNDINKEAFEEITNKLCISDCTCK